MQPAEKEEVVENVDMKIQAKAKESENFAAQCEGQNEEQKVSTERREQANSNQEWEDAQMVVEAKDPEYLLTMPQVVTLAGKSPGLGRFDLSQIRTLFLDEQSLQDFCILGSRMTSLRVLDLRGISTLESLQNLRDGIDDEVVSVEQLTVYTTYLGATPTLKNLLVDTNVSSLAKNTILDVGKVTQIGADLSKENVPSLLNGQFNVFSRTLTFSKKRDIRGMTIEVLLKDIYNGHTILLKIPKDENQPIDELSNFQREIESQSLKQKQFFHKYS